MAQTTDVQREKELHTLRLVPLPVLAATIIFDGMLVCTDANGFAVPADDSAGLIFQGVAHRGYDNSAGANGVVDGNNSERYCEVDNNGPYSLKVTGTTPEPGQDALIVDDDTVSVDAQVADIKAGRFVRKSFVSGEWFVDVERAQ